MHGIFVDDAFRAAFLSALRAARGLNPAERYASFGAEREARIDRVAAHVRGSIDVARAIGDFAVQQR